MIQILAGLNTSLLLKNIPMNSMEEQSVATEFGSHETKYSMKPVRLVPAHLNMNNNSMHDLHANLSSNTTVKGQLNSRKNQLLSLYPAPFILSLVVLHLQS
jgi:antitoxin component HigA of HigAB toxin-antitoxin module